MSDLRECPHCKFSVPVNAAVCGHCGGELRWHGGAAVTKAQKRRERKIEAKVNDKWPHRLHLGLTAVGTMGYAAYAGFSWPNLVAGLVGGYFVSFLVLSLLREAWARLTTR